MLSQVPVENDFFFPLSLERFVFFFFKKSAFLERKNLCQTVPGSRGAHVPATRVCQVPSARSWLIFIQNPEEQAMWLSPPYSRVVEACFVPGPTADTG